MPPPWLHPVQASTKENNDSQATLCPRPPWMSSPGSGNPGTDPQIDRIPVELCPHGNGSQAVGILQPFNVMTPEISEKPSAASSESGDSVLEQPQETEGPWWMSMVHNFTPSWYSMTMATVQSLFLGCCPMGLTTVINMFIFVCIENAGWGKWASDLAWALWWIDVVMAVACSCGLPFLLMHVHQVDLPSMTAVWLLPAATPIVTASNGATVASMLASTNPQHALWTLMVSYVLWGIGFPMAVVTLGVYFHRLTMHKLPPREVIITVFMPVGPLGQASFTIMNLGKMALDLFPETGSIHPLAGGVFYIVGFGTAIILWGFGLVWLVFAVASVTRSRFPFNMGWWGFTFPTGVYVLATLQLGVELPSAFFDILGTVMAVIVVLIWFLVAVITLQRNLIGEINFAPCFLNSRRLRPNREVSDRV
ncbi:C4-dicarboxylate transporter malic acid transport protein [Lasiodiplodia theobromae]|uniref:C4-dicarboxylate transporter malic acid transport protein n=1 Tax=Lasiodiplodia theobromae TaxID=45133 RepID=UPI0015C3A9D7|nr:C4-dicarboxylate transporter malic acid transport protein [Lasiodiplodia theobromae]KAF4543870.1 C4-dicarboxylate transporter malic acid transport protein [Lasiodiplodia theobromae]